MYFPFGFFGDYQIEGGVVVSFTIYIILFKLLNLGLQKIYGSTCGQMVASKVVMESSRWCLPNQAVRVSSLSLVRHQ